MKSVIERIEFLKEKGFSYEVDTKRRVYKIFKNGKVVMNGKHDFWVTLEEFVKSTKTK